MQPCLHLDFIPRKAHFGPSELLDNKFLLPKEICDSSNRKTNTDAIDLTIILDMKSDEDLHLFSSVGVQKLYVEGTVKNNINRATSK